MAKKAIGAVLTILGIILILAGIVVGLVIQFVIVPNTFLNYLDYSRDSKFDDLSYEDCSNETFNAFIFNMTNADDVRNGVAQPIFEQLGPYNYTRRTCVYNETADENYRYYRQYWEPYYLTNDDGSVSDTDLITNFNPAYLGIIHTVAEQAPSNPEFAFLTNFIPQALSQIIEGLQSPDFINPVKANGVPVALNSIFEGLTEQFETVVRTTILTNYLDAVLSDPEEMFTDSTKGYSFISVIGNDGGFTTDQIQDLLYNNESAAVGFTSDDPNGFLTLLQIYQANGLEDTATLYGVSETQVGSLLQWVNTIITTVPPLAGVTDEEVNEQAVNNLYEQWANLTFYSDGLPVPGLPKKAFEVFQNASGISLESCVLLWNTSDPLSFTQVSGISSWLTAGQEYQNGNASFITELAVHFELDPTQASIVLNWINAWFSTYVDPFIETQFGISSLKELAWVQWGSAAVVPGRGSIADSTTLPGVPEFAVFEIRYGSNSVFFSPEKSEELLNGTNGFMLPGNAATFLGLLSANDFDTINETWGINSTEAVEVAGYLDYFLNAFIKVGLFEGQLFPAGGDPITTRTPREWLFEAQDPVLNITGQSPYVGIFYDSDEPPTREAAEQLPLFNETIWRGGSKDEFYDFLQIKTYNGLTTIPQYNNAPVKGNAKGENFVPGMDPDEKLVIWSGSLRRPTTWEKTGEYDLKGIHVWKYEIVPEFWESEKQNPSRSDYFQEEQGVLNLTAVQSLNSYITRPHFYDVPFTFSNSTLLGGGSNTSEYYSNYQIGVEPRSGFTMVKRLLPQIVFGVPELGYFYNIQPGNYPIVWQDDIEVISDDDADTFKDSLHKAFIYEVVAFVVGIGLGLIFLITGIIFIYKAAKGGSGDDSSDGLSMENMD